MSMHLIYGVPFVLWVCGAAFLAAAFCLGVTEWGQRNLFKRKGNQ